MSSNKGKVRVSKREANYLQNKIDFTIDTGDEFFGFIQFYIEEGTKPSSALKIIDFMKDCKNGKSVRTSTSMITEVTNSLVESVNNTKRNISKLKDSFQEIGSGYE